MLRLFNKLIARKNGSTLTAVLANHVYTYPAPSSLNINYSAGSLAGMALVVQILTGLFLTMHYVPSLDGAFDSVEHIMRDVRGGALIRYAHANGASFFFLTVYWHIGRALYYRSYIKNTAAWYIGVAIFFALMAAAFIGYVLPWGQMSLWGATVITNLFSVIPFVGQDVVFWLWGGFGVAAPTLNRFYTLHFLIPFVVLALVIVHLLALHNEGSTTPYFNNHSSENISFGGYYVLKDVLGVLGFLFVFGLFLLLAPNALNHPDNYIPANPMQTPPHIVPEWYFLPFYAILRAIPSKELGVVGMAVSILMLFIVPSVSNYEPVNVPTNSFSLHRVAFWLFVFAVFLLGFLGGQPIMYPYTVLADVAHVLYFGYIPLLALANEAAITREERAYIVNTNTCSKKTKCPLSF